MQVSTINALLAGVYDGEMTCEELLKYGDFGIGTFDRLDGEMIVLDGIVYKVKASGQVIVPPKNETTPFATVLFFKPDMAKPLSEEMDLREFENCIDQMAPNKNVFVGIRLEGQFSRMKTRSVPPQNRPYPPLVEVVKHQSIFKSDKVYGTIVGFRCPSFVKGINVPGYHLHFLSHDKREGGHVLDFKRGEGRVEIDICNRFFMVLPKGEGLFHRVDLEKDRSGQLDRVEK